MAKRETLLASSMGVFGATLALGDGLSQVGLGVLLAACLWGVAGDRNDAKSKLRTLVGLRSWQALAAFIVFAVATLPFSPYGWPQSSEIGRLYDFLAFFAVGFAVVQLGRDRAYRPFVLALGG